MTRLHLRHALVLLASASVYACSGSSGVSGPAAPSSEGAVASSSAGALAESSAGTLAVSTVAASGPGLNVILVGTGTGSVTSDPAGISCRPACSATFATGTVVTLTATASKNSVFAGWTDACLAAGSNTVATVTMDVSKYCTASFRKASGPPAPSGGPDLVAAFGWFSTRQRPNAISCSGVYTTNQGDEEAGASTSKVWFSSNSTLDPGDALLWAVSVPALLPGVTDRQIGDSDPGPAFCVTMPSVRGTYYYFVVADTEQVVAEIDESNNVRTYVVTVK